MQGYNTGLIRTAKHIWIAIIYNIKPSFGGTLPETANARVSTRLPDLEVAQYVHGQTHHFYISLPSPLLGPSQDISARSLNGNCPSRISY